MRHESWQNVIRTLSETHVTFQLTTQVEVVEVVLSIFLMQLSFGSQRNLIKQLFRSKNRSLSHACQINKSDQENKRRDWVQFPKEFILKHAANLLFSPLLICIPVLISADTKTKLLLSLFLVTEGHQNNILLLFFVRRGYAPDSIIKEEIIYNWNGLCAFRDNRNTVQTNGSELFRADLL